MNLHMITTKKGLSKIDSTILAEYILQKTGSMSHLKLQKVLYYIQALHLAYFNEPLIDDEFEAWLHGPVSRKIYDELKDKSILYKELAYKAEEGVETPNEIIEKSLTPDQKELVDEIISEYGKLSASKLEAISHGEDPWINARKGYSDSDRCCVIITKKSMMEYYHKELYEK